jgi:hypothetical protein
MPGETKVQVAPCQEDRRDETCVQTIDVPMTHHDAETHADDTHKYENNYDEEIIATDDLADKDEKFVVATRTIYKEEDVAVNTLATNNKETTDDTLETDDKESAIATLAANDEENAAVEGEPWGA